MNTLVINAANDFHQHQSPGTYMEFLNKSNDAEDKPVADLEGMQHQRWRAKQ